MTAAETVIEQLKKDVSRMQSALTGAQAAIGHGLIIDRLLEDAARYIANHLASGRILPGTDPEGHALARQLAKMTYKDVVVDEIDRLLPKDRGVAS